jgi:hypothetical protein
MSMGLHTYMQNLNIIVGCLFHPYKSGKRSWMVENFQRENIFQYCYSSSMKDIINFDKLLFTK